MGGKEGNGNRDNRERYLEAKKKKKGLIWQTENRRWSLFVV